MPSVNELSAEDWSSKIDQIYLDKASPYEIKGYHNRYFLAWEKVVRPVLVDILPVGGAIAPQVLDGATGSGAGAAYLAERAVAIGRKVCVVGVDVCEEAVKYAQDTYSWRTNQCLDYRMQDVAEALRSQTWDAVVCMETLEHVANEKMHEILKAAAESLYPGGRAVFSMPRKRPRESTKARPGHINELSYQEFKYTIGEYFPMVEFYAFDRYANIVPDYPDCNLQVAVVSTWPKTSIFPSLP